MHVSVMVVLALNKLTCTILSELEYETSLEIVNADISGIIVELHTAVYNYDGI